MSMCSDLTEFSKKEANLLAKLQLNFLLFIEFQHAPVSFTSHSIFALPRASKFEIIIMHYIALL